MTLATMKYSQLSARQLAFFLANIARARNPRARVTDPYIYNICIYVCICIFMQGLIGQYVIGRVSRSLVGFVGQ